MMPSSPTSRPSSSGRVLRWLPLLVLAGCGRFGFAVPDIGELDGKPAVTDLCGELAGEQAHDEDGDGLGDECDPCPHLAGGHEDLDGDMVGDACDPNPTVAGEQIRAFVTFEGGAPGGWTNTWRGTTGALAYVDDAARFDLADDDVGFFTLPDPGAPDLLIDTRFTVEGISPNLGNPARNVAIVDGYDAASDSGLMYGMVYDYNKPAFLGLFIIEVVNSLGNLTFSEVQVGSGYAFDAPYALRFERRTDQRAVVLEDSTDRYVGTTTQPLQQGGVLGLRSRGLRVKFEYVIVIY